MRQGKNTQLEETRQASEQHLNVAEILELWYQEFKVPRINMLMDLMEKVDNIKEQMGNVSIAKNESKGNARNQKQCNRNEECL